eukprot:gene10466-8425_t
MATAADKAVGSQASCRRSYHPRHQPRTNRWEAKPAAGAPTPRWPASDDPWTVTYTSMHPAPRPTSDDPWTVTYTSMHPSPRSNSVEPTAASTSRVATAADKSTSDDPHAAPSTSAANKAVAGQTSRWRSYHPLVSMLAASPNGALVATAGSAGISLVRLPVTSSGGGENSRLEYTGRVFRATADSPISGLSFSADSKLLAAVLSCSALSLFDVEAGRAHPWALDHAAAIATCLQKLPGAPAGCSFDPEAKKQYKRMPRTDTVPSPALSRGSNGRAILVQDPCVFVGHIGGSGAVLLEKPWSDVCQGFPPPLFKHRYGT